MRKTLTDARHAFERTALIARNEELQALLTDTLDLCHRNHLVHEVLRRDASTLRRKAKKLSAKTQTVSPA